MIGMQTAVTRLEHTRVNAEVDFLETEKHAQVTRISTGYTLVCNLVLYIYVSHTGTDPASCYPCFSFLCLTHDTNSVKHFATVNHLWRITYKWYV